MPTIQQIEEFRKSLEPWIDEPVGDVEQIVARERAVVIMLRAYQEGSDILDLTDLGLTSIPREIAILPVSEIIYRGNNLSEEDKKIIEDAVLTDNTDGISIAEAPIDDKPHINTAAFGAVPHIIENDIEIGKSHPDPGAVYVASNPDAIDIADAGMVVPGANNFGAIIGAAEDIAVAAAGNAEDEMDLDFGADEIQPQESHGIPMITRDDNSVGEDVDYTALLDLAEESSEVAGPATAGEQNEEDNVPAASVEDPEFDEMFNSQGKGGGKDR